MISIKKVLTKIITRLNIIGDRKTAVLSSAVTLSSSATTTNLLSVVLDPGIWIVAGQVGYNGASDTTYRSCYIANTSTDSNYAAAQVSASTTGNTVVNACATLSLSNSTTIYLNARHGSSSSVTVTTQSKITAVRIK